MSPVFRHGRLRLYLLKLLDESPRHGYEIIRLLQDRFLGVYAPSPGTIYPRLARLEEEGLVTHDEADGRKVYRITDKGREELHARLDDLNDLEEEITASVRDIAREVSEDVRETVRTLREELTWAAREFHTRARGPAGDAGQDPAESARQAREQARQERDRARRERDEAHRERDRARQGRAQSGGGREARGRDKQSAGAGQAERGGAARDQGEAPWDEATSDWADTGPGQQHEHAGRHWGHKDWGDWASWAGWGGWHGPPGPHGCQDPRAYRDLERLARQFSRELRTAAWQAQAISEDAVRNLRAILDEAIDRIRAEVFEGSPAPHRAEDPGDDAGARPGDGPDS